ncbi:MAG: hypothetical protein E4H44_03485, partial [Candidatus Aminicenantes bacterium]
MRRLTLRLRSRVSASVPSKSQKTALSGWFVSTGILCLGSSVFDVMPVQNAMRRRGTGAWLRRFVRRIVACLCTPPIAIRLPTSIESPPMESLSTRQCRRLALARAGLLKPEWTGMPKTARGRGPSARRACLEIVRRFGYLQLDSIGVTGARTQGLVLMSRLDGLDPSLAEDLLQPGEPLFEHLGHEACWQPMEDWPLFAFRRRELRDAPRWGAFVADHRDVATEILRRIETEGPLRSLDFESGRFGGNWQLKIATFVASALWGTGELAIRERRSFQRVYDLAERVIPNQVRSQSMTFDQALPELI